MNCIPDGVRGGLILQYNQFFRAAMGDRPIPSDITELREFADACDTAASNLAQDVPNLSAGLSTFAQKCREAADRHSGK
jgi:hypothetical protein